MDMIALQFSIVSLPSLLHIRREEPEQLASVVILQNRSERLLCLLLHSGDPLQPQFASIQVHDDFMQKA